MGNHTATRARGRSNDGTKARAISLDQRAAVALARASAERTRELNPPQAAAARWVARWLSAHPITEPIPPSTPGLAKESARSRESRLYQNWQRPAEWIEATRGIRAVDPNAYHHATAAATEQGMVAQREWLANSTASGRGGRSSATIRSKTKGGAAKASGSKRAPTEETIIGPRQHWSGESDMHAATNQWAAKMSVKPTSISFADLPGKWGTMDTAGHLTLSRSLLTLPPRLGEYVMVHELAHRLAPNHGIVFQAYLHAYMPDWHAREAALQKLGLSETGAPSSAKRTSRSSGGGSSTRSRTKKSA